ncbi:MAG TPA: hypothetical protein VGC81_08945 [Candidatus Methylomirabilis sp.]
MSQPAEPVSLASRLLKVEQKIEAYQELHADELAELWQELNECKRQIVVGVSDQASGPNVDSIKQAEGDRDE